MKNTELNSRINELGRCQTCTAISNLNSDLNPKSNFSLNNILSYNLTTNKLLTKQNLLTSPFSVFKKKSSSWGDGVFKKEISNKVPSIKLIYSTFVGISSNIILSYKVMFNKLLTKQNLLTSPFSVFKKNHHHGVMIVLKK